MTKAKTMPHAKKRSTKKSALALPMELPGVTEQLDAMRAQILDEDAVERSHLDAVDEPLPAEPAPVVIAVEHIGPVTGEATKLGRTLVRWLKDQQRRHGVVTDAQVTDIYDVAVKAARAARRELGA
jgi:hypothetical protein